jgi:hypothetical protein
MQSKGDEIVRLFPMIIAVCEISAAGHMLTPAPVAAQSEAFSNPSAHCRAVVNEDNPPGWDRGTRSMARAAGITESVYAVHWRCSNGQVLVCGVVDMHETSCSQRDRRQQAEDPEYCRENPNAQFIPFSAGNRRSVFDWRCRGKVPVVAKRYISESELTPAGYMIAEWSPLVGARDFLSASLSIVDVEVTANARVRDHPTTNGSVVLGVIRPGRFLSGQWVPADDGNGRWLRVDLASLEEIQGQSSWPYGYIWEGNLRPVRPSSNGPSAAGPASTLRSDLQARADRFYAAADLSGALEALADIVGVLTKMRDAGDLYIATQVFEIYDAPGSELALADMTRKNVWTLAQMVSTGLLKGWYARAKETGRKPPIRYEYAEVMVQNVLYAARAGSGDVPGAIADASGDQIDRIKEIAITYQQIRGQNETLVHNALNSALLDLDRYSRGELDYTFVLQNIINSRKIATNLDSTTRRLMRDDTSTRLIIVADLQELKLKVLKGDDVSMLLESMTAQYQGNGFARDAAFLLGVPGWNNARSSLSVSGRTSPGSKKEVSLTTINNALMMDCFISLDEQGQKTVGFSRGNFWRFGINDQVYHFDLADSSYDQGNGEFTLFDNRRAISVAIRPTGKRSTSKFEYDLVDLNVAFGESRARITGFRFCQLDS